MTLLRQLRNLMQMTGRLVAVAILTTVAYGQEPLPQTDGDELLDEEEEIRRYSVELIVFEYADTAAGSDEIFLPDAIPLAEEPDPEAIDAIAMFGDATTGSGKPGAFPEQAPEPEIDPQDVPLEEIIVPAQVGMIAMAPEDYSMNGIYERLAGLSAYKVLMRGGWTQATVDRELAPPIRLRVLGHPPLYLDGSLTLYLSRYLHLVVDLTMESMDGGAPQNAAADVGPVVTFGDERTQNDYGYAPPEMLSPQIRYRIFEDRIVKNGDLRYFDHPKFGVLAKVTRNETALTDTPGAETPESMLLPGPIE